MDRQNTNEKVLNQANQKIRDQGGRVCIRRFSEVYKQQKMSMYQSIVAADVGDPMKQCTLNAETLEDAGFAQRRVGRPRLKWNATTAK